MAWTFIQHLSAPTSNQFTFSSLSLGGYQRVLLLVDGAIVGTDGAFLNLTISTGSGFNTSGYRYYHASRSSSGSSDSTAQDTPASGAFIRVLGGASSTWGIGNAATESGSSWITVSNVGSGLYKTVDFNSSHVAPSGSGVRVFGGGLLEQTAAIDGLRISVSTGTMTGGKATLYGLPTS